MILRGLLIAASGFLFIFSPGIPLSLLTRRAPGIERGLIYWGLGLWPVALLPALFLQSLLRQVLEGNRPAAPTAGQPADYLFALGSAIIAAVILQGAMYLLLRFKRPSAGEIVPAGLSLGFGIGLVSQVFTGLGLVSAGFRLALGASGDPLLTPLAQTEGWRLALSLLPVVLFRPALLVMSALRGLLVARSLGEGARLWWAAVAADAGFAWLAVALQLALGSENPSQIVAGAAPPASAVLAAVYYAAAFGLAFWWIVGRLEAKPGAASRPVGQPSATVHRG